MENTYIIFLTEDSIKEIGAALKQWSASSNTLGEYIRCNEVNTMGSFVHIQIVEQESDQPEVKYEIELPHRYIKLIISGSDMTKIGFL